MKMLKDIIIENPMSLVVLFFTVMVSVSLMLT